MNTFCNFLKKLKFYFASQMEELLKKFARYVFVVQRPFCTTKTLALQGRKFTPKS
jgi:hypothetical protein